MESYYVIVPVDGLRMDFDYRMYSAELYGCPPDYKPRPEACAEFRQPYEILGKMPFHGYKKLVSEGLFSDASTIDVLADLPDRTMIEFTCIGFQTDFDKSANWFDSPEDTGQRLFSHIIERGESFLDPLRFCVFKPGRNESLGKFGSIGNGIQCFWIGNNNDTLKFFARRSIRFTLTQKPLDVLETQFAVIDCDITFHGLCHMAFEHPIDIDLFYGRMLKALRAFRESRDIVSPEARFRHLAAIAEDLAKTESEENKKLSGNPLRDRIAKISSRGWELYKSVNDNHPRILKMSKHSHQLIAQRYKDLGWEDEEEAKAIIRDLWSNVRNPLSHSLETFQTLGRDVINDIANLEKVVVTMVNGLYAAYEVEDLYEKPAHVILLDSKNNSENAEF